MSLTTMLAEQVPAAVRQRSVAYFLGGAVRILEGSALRVRAKVLGTRLEEVTLCRTQDLVSAGCSCSEFHGRGAICKHIWATVVRADRQGFLQGPAGEPLRLVGDASLSEATNEQGTGGEALPTTRAGGGQPRAQAPEWRRLLARVRPTAQPRRQAIWPAGRQVLYVVDVPVSLTAKELQLEVAWRERKRNGEWGKPKPLFIDASQLGELTDPADRQILSLLAGPREASFSSSYRYYSYHRAGSCYSLSAPLAEALLPRVCQTGRCWLRLEQQAEPQLLQWENAPWELWLEIARESSGARYLVSSWLRRGEERRPLAAAHLVIAGGLVLWDDHAARLQDFGAFAWVKLLRKQRTITVPIEHGDQLLQELLGQPVLPRLEVPEELRFEESAPSPRPLLQVRAHKQGGRSSNRLAGELSFDYDGVVVSATAPGRGRYDPERRRFVVRDSTAEQTALERLRELGFRPPTYREPDVEGLVLAARHLPAVVRALLAEGWQVEAEGKIYRRPGVFNIEVSSGIDWFDLHGKVAFGETNASLPAILAAAKRGEEMVRLDDGTYGMLPAEWLKRHGLLARMGKVEGDHLRFLRSQLALLDALLASQPEASCDAVFARARAELCRFDGVQPADAPAGFVGALRGYQRDGLGWLYFLQRFGFGGCLADDMGLGKTVQVLALLESRRALRATQPAESRWGPSLVVVPRSLVFNWKQEAARFTPRLRILDHSGTGRLEPGEHFNDYDVVLTTYGTLRSDILRLKDVHFDYCILDESQNIKNAATASAKAVRLLNGQHRLALSGTPIENHLGELWSLFEFLNPGMLGAASVFHPSASSARGLDEAARALLAHALRPFILRRTKAQVALELPQKNEQTLYCELESPQRKHYDELREHYRRLLLDKVAREGFNRARLQVLEALLRLRQAACHPGLIDKTKAREPSAKLDVALPRLEEVAEEGHKALVFSQFTSLLAILRDRLDRAGVPYEYLDGKTRDREARVQRFQTDPECRLFLISLKAGGLGLNLTAAEYVFLLDPWWNPAVEAQAIDRAHRIGQTRQVFAYRLIARDTVEEKVLELQQSKRELADAIINAESGPLSGLTPDDLRLLLS